MWVVFNLLKESLAQALYALASNKLRSVLSLLGITVGIFCIIGVKSAVDSLESNVRSSFDKLGKDVIYVSKFPWAGATREQFEKYLRRPNSSFTDYRQVNRKVKSAQYSSFYVFIGRKTLTHGNLNVQDVGVLAATYEYAQLFDIKFESGRYFSSQEYFYGAPKVVIGHDVATNLFPGVEAVGRTLKLEGRKLEVIGVIEKAGEDLIGIMDYDDRIVLPYSYGKKVFQLKSNIDFQNAFLAIRAQEGVSIDQLKDDVTGAMRAVRRLSPRAEDNFAINELSMMTEVFDLIFSNLRIMALIVGLFAILVGMFSVANIMFVSVKERTKQIGIKKALGAKSYVILMEFLIESILLCLLGGAVGLLLVWATVTGLSDTIGFELQLSVENMLIGTLGSVVIGVLSGVIPAILASNMNPVDAIRNN